jgi:NAD+ kinase
LPSLFSFCFSDHPLSQSLKGPLIKKYGQTTPEKAQTIIVLGGDGFMLRKLHALYPLKKPFYGINCGSKGALMNTWEGWSQADAYDLVAKIEKANDFRIHPLDIHVQSLTDQWNQKAWNEGCIYRSQYKSLHFSVQISKRDFPERNPTDFIGDGCIVATSLGSSAYNFSANGKTIPLSDQRMVWTPLNTGPTSQKQSRILEKDDTVCIKIKNKDQHYATLGCDVFSFPQVVQANISLDLFSFATLLHNVHQ